MMRASTRIRDWNRFLRRLDDDPIRTVITHLTHDPPLIHVICERQRFNLTLNQIDKLHQNGKLPEPVTSYLTTQGVIGGAKSDKDEHKGPQLVMKFPPG